MAIEIDKMFTVNEDSLKHSLEILVDQRLNFRPISREKYKEIIKVDMREIPYDGTIEERNTFIDETLDKLIDKLEEENKIKLLKEPEDSKEEPGNGNDTETTTSKMSSSII